LAPHVEDSLHHLYSVTKSITSALVGIAIKQGAIKSVHQPVLDFFPKLANVNRDRRIRAMTIEHLLEMETGLEWNESRVPYGTRRNSVSQMKSSPDWIHYYLSRRMVAEPGTMFAYSSAATHLLSAIIQRQTGITASSYAQERLFDPLGISNVQWTADPNGITTGGWGLYLTARDTAKIGYLYLNRGSWSEAEVVPPHWVDASTTKHATVISAKDLRYRLARLLWWALRRDSLPVTSMDYGYHWWLPPFGGYAALGYAGQSIFVVPDLKLVVVFTG